MSNDPLRQYGDSRLKVKAAGETVKALITSFSEALTKLAGPWDRIVIKRTQVEVPRERYEGQDDRIWVAPWPTTEEMANALTAWRNAIHEQASASEALSPTEKENSASPLGQDDI